MAGNLFTLPKQSPLDNGAVIPGGKLYFYATGTATPQNTYTDIDLTTASSNPVVADADGVFAPIYFDPALPNYRVTLTDADDVQVYQVDDVPAAPAPGKNVTVEDAAPYIDLVESDAASDNGVWRIQVNGEQMTISLGDDAKSTFNPFITVDRTANTADLVNIEVTALQLNDDPLFASGSFTGTLTGYASGPTPTVQWRRSVNTVWLTVNAGSTGTSNATSLTMTGVPAAIRPASSLTVFTRVQDNGANSLGVAAIGTDGTITFGLGATGGVFTNSGTKGLPGGWSLVYDLQ